MGARSYATIQPSFWTGKTGRELRDEPELTHLLAAYFITSPHANMIGAYYCPLGYAAHETGRSLEAVRASVARLVDLDFLVYDYVSEFVWVREMASRQLGEPLSPRDKRSVGAKREAGRLPEPIRGQFMTRYVGKLWAAENRPPVRSGSGTGSGTGTGSEQEQDQDPLRSQEAPPKQTTTKLKPVPVGNVSFPKSSIVTIFDTWRSDNPGQFLTPHSGLEEWRLIERRLADGITVEQICKAIGGMKLDPWRGRDANRSLYHIVKDNKSIYRLIAIADDTGGKSESIAAFIRDVEQDEKNAD